MTAQSEPDRTDPRDDNVAEEARGSADDTAQVGTEPGAPSDNTTLTAILSALNEDGFDAQFVVREGAEIECLACGSTSPASRFVARRARRLEGASDPDDMVHVVASTCPVCTAGGTVVLGYGVNASPDDGDVSLALDLRSVDIEIAGVTIQKGAVDDV